MEKVLETVQRIERPYVSDDCIQIMIPYRNALTIVNQDGILFHHKIGSDYYVNKYLEDERRGRFPYHNIPTHYSKKGLFKVYAFTNQLFEYEKPYIRIGDNSIAESYVIKDKDTALLINTITKPKNSTKYMTYDELQEFISKGEDDDEIYYVYLDGSLPGSKRLFPTEERIEEFIKNRLATNIKDFREYQSENPGELVAQYLKNNPWFLDFAELSIKNLDLNAMDFNVRIGEESTLMIIRVKNGELKIQGVEVMFVSKDDYKVEIFDIPVSKFVLEQLKFIPRINITTSPTIPLKLNPSVTRHDIIEAKQMELALRK